MAEKYVRKPGMKKVMHREDYEKATTGCIVEKKYLEGLNRIDLWRVVSRPDEKCPESAFLAAKVYAERTLKSRPGPRDGYYGENLLKEVIDTIDDSGKLKKTAKRSRVVEFMGLVYME